MRDRHGLNTKDTKVDENYCVSYLSLTKNGNCVRLAEETKAMEILDGFNSRSQEIKKIGFVEEKYKEFAYSFLDFYLQALSGKRSVIFRIIKISYQKIASGISSLGKAIKKEIG